MGPGEPEIRELHSTWIGGSGPSAQLDGGRCRIPQFGPAETMATVEPDGKGDSAHLRLVHAGFPRETAKKRHERAWPLVLEQLDGAVSKCCLKIHPGWRLRAVKRRSSSNVRVHHDHDMPRRLDAMNAAHIAKLASATLTGAMPFSEIVARLLDEGVECYLVDYRALQFTFYGTNGGVVIAPLTFEGLPEVAEHFDLASLASAIHASQTQAQKFREFCRRAVLAGVQSYYVFLRGKRVTYLGRQGEQHTEWFPGVRRP